MKKLICLALTAVLALMTALPCLAAPSAKATISLSSSKVTVGDKVKVTVKYSSSSDIGSYDFILEYDASVLKYVIGGDSGGNGKIRFANYNENSSLKSFSRTVTFEAKASGTANIATKTNAIVDNSSFSLMGVTEASAKVTVNPKPTASTNNKLKSLAVSSAELEPAFSASVTEYSATVAYTVKNLTVSAVTEDSKAKVSISDTALNVGANKITITVTAESGAKKNYVLNVTRAESTLADVTCEIDGVTYKFAYDPDELTPPEGFSETVCSYKGHDVLGYKDEGGFFTLVWLVPALSNASVPTTVYELTQEAAETSENQKQTQETKEAAEGWYLLENDSLIPYTVIESASPLHVIVDRGESAMPEGDFEKAVLSVGDAEFEALRDDYCKENGLYIIYARRYDGKEGFFVFNTDGNAVYPYIPPQTVTVTVTESAPETTEAAQVIATAEARGFFGQEGLYKIIAAAACALSLILFIILAASSRKHARKVDKLNHIIAQADKPAPKRMRAARNPQERFSNAQDGENHADSPEKTDGTEEKENGGEEK